MDPNQNLKDMRWLAERIHCGELDRGQLAASGERLAQLFDALDEWILRGGFLPESWEKAQREARSRESMGR